MLNIPDAPEMLNIPDAPEKIETSSEHKEIINK